ncbi:hypothetical protein CCUS01_05388 [Colletotrichum cuscutae]|uniref:Xylanolytic transcriptional activator regulatory domain-containing protein n=1 Tax=Colletotrichum cuscutae TaxID=1209917 RepID=A0AAI9Y4F4_9PEZI|nr:hypothetical protein CCUS01_05388 [Colletotrichum cuscutae]
MSTTTRRAGRLPSSCVNCRRRKIKVSNGATSMTESRTDYENCVVTDEASIRPYYHTSKEQFELMAAIVQHYTPGIPLSVESLRTFVSKLQAAPQQPDFPTEFAQQVPPADTSSCSPVDGGHLLPGVAAKDSASPMSEGSFISDSTRQRRFNGASSYAVLQSKVSLCITRSFPRLAALQPSGTFDLREGEPLSNKQDAALPDRKTCERCSVVFLRFVNCVFYVLGPEKLFDAIVRAHGYAEVSVSTQAMIQLIVALIDDDPHHFELASKKMESVIEEGSVESIQAIIVMALYRLKKSQRNTSWVVLGSAIRIAQSLGLHVATDDESPLWAEQKTKLWWSLCDLDQWFTSVLGRSLGITVDLSTIGSPSDNLIGAPNMPPMYAFASARLTRLLSRTLQCNSEKHCDNGNAIDLLIQDLYGWWESLPQHLTIPAAAIPPSLLRATLYLRLRYHCIIVLLTQSYLFNATFSGSDADHRMNICEDSNNKTIATLIEMQERDVLTSHFWFDSYHAVTCGLVLLIRIIKNPASVDLRDMVIKLRSLLRMFPDRLHAFAVQCFDKVLEDIEHRQ